MKKFLITGLILLAVSGCVLASETIEKGYIAVSAEEVKEISPNVAKLSFGIETSAQDAQTAADLNVASSKKAIEAVKALIDTANGDTIATTTYIVNPRYTYKDGKQKLTGYYASNVLKVTVKDTKKVGQIISTALANGANSVNNVQFTLDETGYDCNELISAAVKSAKDRANMVASSLNTSVTGVKSLTVGCSTSQNGFTNYRLFAKNAVADGAENASVPIETGKAKIRAYVDAHFYIK